MVKSGEASGKLDKVLVDLADQLEGDYAMKSKIKGAMIYPIFILGVIAVVGTLALIYIIPQLEDIFTSSGAQLPFLTLLLIKLSHFLRSFWYLAVLIVVGVGVAIKYFTMTETGKYAISYVSLHMPGFKAISRGIYITNFAKTLALLVSGGVPIIKSLSMVSDSLGNSIVEKELKYTLLEVEKGIPLSTPLSKSKIFPGLVSSMVAVGEQTGQLDKILFDIARIYEQDTNNLLKGITALLEPIIMLLVGIAVMFLVVAIILPIYQLSNVF
jgi:type II secretory pathway component PulF